ncbi:MAG TPA: FadR/GntR family transcriptional regulator [Bauldia sp.]|nr:FadR/GntR family transcriptional regulator [Bauldia sp.]
MASSDTNTPRARRTRAQRSADGRAIAARPLADLRVPSRLEESPLKRNIHGFLANKLGEEIVGGVFPPGSLLPNEAEMCARFRVSRTALREAYSVLAAKALIVARPKIGTRVRPKSDWNMLDPEVLAWHLQTVPTEEFVSELHALRQMVEPGAAALAARDPTPKTIERITAAYAAMERSKDGEGDLIDADLQFHLAILEATGNHFIGALGGLIHAALLTTFRLSWEGAARMRDGRLQQHKAVFEAIRDRKPALAQQRMTDLLVDSRNDVSQFLSQGDKRDGRRRPREKNGSHD